MKKNHFKIIFSSVIIGIFLFFAVGCSSNSKNSKIDINDTKAIDDYIQGKWSWEKHTGSANETWRYRFEIDGNKLKIWSCINNLDDPFDMNMKGDPVIIEFTLGQPVRDMDGYHCRYLQSDDANFTYRALSSIWFVADEHWDEPVIRSGSGIPSWSKGWQ